MSALPCRLIIDPPGNGAWNMAVDEVLLDQAANQGTATLRFYQWRPATLSLGYFQQHSLRHQHSPSLGCPLVRRHSGGGAIIHDQELTYSLALPAGAHPARDPYALYLAVHRSLRDTLIDLSGGALHGRLDLCPQPITPAAGGEPLLCFQRRASGDLLIATESFGLPQSVDGMHKVAGSSQRKRRGAVLQHGSILLRSSAYSPELPGLAEAGGLSLTAENLAEVWAPTLASGIGLGIVRFVPNETIKEKADAMMRNRFACPEWTARR